MESGSVGANPGPRSTYRSITVSSLGEYETALDKMTGGRRDAHFYRGQGNARWPVDCSAARRLRQQLGVIDEAVLQVPLFAYINMLTQQARAVIEPESIPDDDVELLAELQHYGAATHLIDFTECPRIALWFACENHPDAHAAVYVLNEAETSPAPAEDPAMQAAWHEAHVLRHWKPPSSARVNRQRSVFIFGPPVISRSHLGRIVITGPAKPAIIERLLQDDDLTRSRMFPDAPGVADLNKVSRPINEVQFLLHWSQLFDLETMDPKLAAGVLHIDGMMHTALERHEEAIARYDASLRLHESAAAHNSRGLAKKATGDLGGALTDFDAAVALEPESGMMRFHRAQVLMQLGRIEEGQETLQRAVRDGYNPLGQPTMRPSSVSQAVSTESPRSQP